jgi:hypothetical protein
MGEERAKLMTTAQINSIQYRLQRSGELDEKSSVHVGSHWVDARHFRGRGVQSGTSASNEDVGSGEMLR